MRHPTITNSVMNSSQTQWLEEASRHHELHVSSKNLQLNEASIYHELTKSNIPRKTTNSMANSSTHHEYVIHYHELNTSSEYHELNALSTCHELNQSSRYHALEYVSKHHELNE
mmetsp:Transcript_96561/g.155796  ORF Transcript_96561/g.155796 Transcript_96561/m.155796 type:complete len:114 (+) Transcript_96561:195-536(+)